MNLNMNDDELERLAAELMATTGEEDWNNFISNLSDVFTSRNE